MRLVSHLETGGVHIQNILILMNIAFKLRAQAEYINCHFSSFWYVVFGCGSNSQLPVLVTRALPLHFTLQIGSLVVPSQSSFHKSMEGRLNKLPVCSH